MKNIFRKREKKEKYIEVNKKPNVQEGTWIKCDLCGEIMYKEDFQRNHHVCTKCNKYFRMGVKARLRLIVDKNSFQPMFEEVVTKNPLSFPQYEEKVEKIQEKTGISEGILVGKAKICGKDVAIGIMDTRFLMGSMGWAVGERITRLTEFAGENQLPLVLFTASGGARMQEGIISLMQMAKTSAAIKRFSDKGGLYIAVLTDPTTGGVTASFAMLADIIITEPGSLICFAGSRVIKQTMKQDLPSDFQRAEFLKEKGFIDKIVKREALRKFLYQVISLHIM